jgi:hypothetical protein
MVDMDQVRKYEELKSKLDTLKIRKAREEALIEASELQIEEILKDIKRLTGSSSVEKAITKLDAVSAKLDEAVEKAENILDSVGVV